MSKVLDDLVDLLNPELTGVQTFVADSQDLGFKALFGGQILAQSLASALKTLPDDELLAHSFHAYFLLPGDASEPVTYQVEVLRDGRSYVTREVKAIQHDKVILSMMCSFQRPEEGLSHQVDMPTSVQGPEGVASQVELARMFKDFLPEKYQQVFTKDKPVELRIPNPVNPFNPEKREPVKYIWVKANGQLPDDLGVHQALMSYTSDFHFLETALYPHAKSYMKNDVRLASLDHGIWFHRPFRMDEWLLYAIDSPFSGGGRGFCRGQFFNQHGELVASTVQEGLVRELFGDKPA